MTRWFWITLLGGAAWTGIYLLGRLIAAWLGYGRDIGMGDAFAVMIPTILGVTVAHAIWDRR